MRILVLITIIPLLQAQIMRAQHLNVSVPMVQNYPKSTYGGGTQNWGFAQSQNGILYAANNEGLLEFDSEEWRVHSLPNKTIVRSVAISPDQRIYVGGQDEFGYFDSGPGGQLVFQSLKPRIDTAYRQFEDVWSIVTTEDAVLFRASNRIYLYAEDTIRVLHSARAVKYLGYCNGAVYVQDDFNGLARITQGIVLPVADGQLIRNDIVSAVIPLGKDTALVFTAQRGAFMHTRQGLQPWRFDTPEFLHSAGVTAATWLPGHHVAIATERGGLLIADRHGRSVYALGRSAKLQTNHIRSLFADRDANLWLGLENGIDQVLTNTPFKRLIPDGDLEGTAYAALINENNAYFGTSNGLYHVQWDRPINPLERPDRLQLVANTLGQVWGLSQVGNSIFLGHNTGAYIVHGIEASQVSNETGYWRFLPDPMTRAAAIGGNYQGLRRIIEDPEGLWIPDTRISALVESSRIICTDHAGHIWVSHPYRGIYKVSPYADSSSAPEFYGQAHGLPSDQNNFVVSIGDAIVVCAERGVYRYEPSGDHFVIDSAFNEIFGPATQVRYLVEDANENIWYALNDEVGVLQVADHGVTKTTTRVTFPQLTDQLVDGFEFIYPYNAHNVFFGTDMGFIHYNPSQEVVNSLLETNISRVYTTVNGDSLIAGSGNNASPVIQEFASDNNAFRFHFGSTWYQDIPQAEYQYMLVGLDDDWQSWTEAPFHGYANLRPGEYTFKVRSRIPGGAIGSVDEFQFEVLPPWHQTRVAYALYVLLITGLLLGIVFVPRRRYKKERAKLERAHQAKEQSHLRAVQRSEEEIIRLENEKLAADVAHRNQELASSTMHLVQKNALLNRIADELERLRQSTSEDRTRQNIGKLIRLVERDKEVDKDWDHFAFYFDQVHGDFFKHLSERYPQLTPKDHKLCAYLRLNLSSKEIAPLLNISTRGVEISRYRLRKKLGLTGQDNLNEFLMKFGEAPKSVNQPDRQS